MRADIFIDLLGAEFWAGVPDSQLRALCDCLMEKYETDADHHVIAANEGNAIALAAGYYLAAGKIPAVYMQNSGEGNVINPLASLMNERVYGIPCILVIGWRGEPGVHDEPQHIYQGEITLKLLEIMGIPYFVVEKETSEPDIERQMLKFQNYLTEGKQVAFVVKKGALSYEKKIEYQNNHSLQREMILEHIVKYSAKSPIVSTTGKASRELFEIRERMGEGHECDFLTVGSMGHSSSIALGIALQRKEEMVWCIDGDGAILMHMGALATIGSSKVKNFVHILINNGAHESVGGMPTVAEKINIAAIAEACGYEYVAVIDTAAQLDRELEMVQRRKVLTFLEVKCAIGSRPDLGRPTKTTYENKETFMKFLREK